MKTIEVNLSARRISANLSALQNVASHLAASCQDNTCPAIVFTGVQPAPSLTGICPFDDLPCDSVTYRDWMDYMVGTEV